MGDDRLRQEMYFAQDFLYSEIKVHYKEYTAFFRQCSASSNYKLYLLTTVYKIPWLMPFCNGSISARLSNHKITQFLHCYSH